VKKEINFKTNIMIKKIFLVASVLSIIFSGCTKENDVKPLSEKDLVGKWLLKNIGTKLDDNINYFVTPAVIKTAKLDGQFYDFKADKTFTDFDDNGTYAIDPATNLLTISYSDGYEESYYVELSGSQVIFSTEKALITDQNRLDEDSDEGFVYYFVSQIFNDQPAVLTKLEKTKAIQVVFKYSK
jgi:hypothetical protein